MSEAEIAVGTQALVVGMVAFQVARNSSNRHHTRYRQNSKSVGTA